MGEGGKPSLPDEPALDRWRAAIRPRKPQEVPRCPPRSVCTLAGLQFDPDFIEAFAHGCDDHDATRAALPAPLVRLNQFFRIVNIDTIATC